MLRSNNRATTTQTLPPGRRTALFILNGALALAFAFVLPFICWGVLASPSHPHALPHLVFAEPELVQHGDNHPASAQALLLASQNRESAHVCAFGAHDGHAHIDATVAGALGVSESTSSHDHNDHADAGVISITTTDAESQPTGAATMPTLAIMLLITLLFLADRLLQPRQLAVRWRWRLLAPRLTSLLPPLRPPRFAPSAIAA